MLNKSTKPQIEDYGDRLVVTFRPKRSWLDIVFLTLWLLGWLAGLVEVSRAFLHANLGQALFLLCWLTMWLVFGAAASWAVAWMLRGREILTVTSSDLVVVRRVGRIARTKRYHVPLIEHIGVKDKSDEGYALGIAYRDGDGEIGEAMTKDEANELAATLMGLTHPRSWWDETAPRNANVAEREFEGPRSNSRPVITALALTIVAYLAVYAVVHRNEGRDAKQAAEHPAHRPVGRAFPRRADFSEPGTYGAAATAWMLENGPSELVSEPICDANPTWTHWSCTALAREHWYGPLANRIRLYRCETDPAGGFRCGLAQRHTP